MMYSNLGLSFRETLPLRLLTNGFHIPVFFLVSLKLNLRQRKVCKIMFKNLWPTYYTCYIHATYHNTSVFAGDYIFSRLLRNIIALECNSKRL